MFDHKQLRIWRRSHELALGINRALVGRARNGPPGLAGQLSRACMSIPANIAEGAGQDTPNQSARFFDVAIGSLSETESHLEMASATGLLSSKESQRFADEVQQIRMMTFSFRKWLLRQIANEK